MALVKCPDCGRMISDQASTCIGCGRPAASRSPVRQEDREAAEAAAWVEGLTPANRERHAVLAAMPSWERKAACKACRGVQGPCQHCDAREEGVRRYLLAFPAAAAAQGRPLPLGENPRPRRAVWNPAAAARWSLLFSPAFGSYLHMLNWSALGKPGRAVVARRWFRGSLALLATVGLLSAADPAASWKAALFLGWVLLLVWYLSAGRVQVNYLREKYGSGYSRKPWGEPLRAGAGAIVGFVVLTSTVGLMFRTGDEVRRAVDPTAAPPPRSVAGSRPGAGPASQETRSAELGARGELGPGPAREALEAWKLYVYQRSKQLPHPPPAVPRSSLSVADAAELAEFEQQLHLEAWKLYLFLQRKRTPAVAPVVPRGALSTKSAAELAEYEQQLDKFK